MSWLWRLPSRLALALVHGYQRLISPMLPPACRFSPSCSHYACACLTDHGFMRGSWLTLRRLSRCHPWHPGGYDPPPPSSSALREDGQARGPDLGSRPAGPHQDSNMPRTTPAPSPRELARETTP